MKCSDADLFFVVFSLSDEEKILLIFGSYLSISVIGAFLLKPEEFGYLI